MKEQLRLLWQLEDYEKAQRFLETWCKDAWNTGIKHLEKVANTLASFKTAILNYFKFRITNSVTEGVVYKIKTLRRQAYGYRDMEYFKLRLYNLHTQKYSLTG
jgi:transposase